MQCPNCGHTLRERTRFCPRCGVQLPQPPDVASGAAAVPPPPPQPGMPPSGQGAGVPTGPSYAPPPPQPWGTPLPAPPGPTGAAPPGPYEPSNPYGPPPGTGPGPYAPSGTTAAPNPYAPPPAGYGYGYAPGYGVAARTNGLAVASLVLGIVGWVPCGVGSILAIVFGLIARNQIRASAGRETGEGMAKAGIILGCCGLALMAYVVVAAVISASHGSSSGSLGI